LYALDVFMITNRYYAPNIGTYVETDILIPGATVRFVKNERGTYSGTIEITLAYKKNNETVAFDKYLLHSFEINDSNDVRLSMVDRKRMVLPPGTYTLEAVFKDIHANAQKSLSETFILDIPEDRVTISDIMFADKYYKSDEENVFVKSGFHITPYVLNYFPENVNKITFYAEIYHTDKALPGEQFLVNYSINKYKRNDPMLNMKRFIKMQSDVVKVIFAEFNIETLPSGNYEVVIDVRDRQNRLLAQKKCFFQRSNVLNEIAADDVARVQVEHSFVANWTLKEMQYQLRTLKPIVNIQERKTINSLAQSNNLELMKQFFLNFWMQKNPSDPQKAWAEYQKKVDEVNQMFSTCLGDVYGFETDRGRVYLQYGKPNDIITRPWEPLNYPYEVWQYYSNEHTKQTNVKFVFINRDMGCDNFKLEHSDMLGEIYNNQWPQMLDRRNTRNANTDEYWDAKRVRPYDPVPGSHINTIIRE
jgi:GWxTD domain-containing protein